MSSQFSGKVAIITGASSGLGQATAVVMAQRGASITLCGRDEKRLQEVAKECVEISQRSEECFLTIPGDVTKAEIRQKIVEKTVKEFGQVDILVNNAGISLPQKNVLDITEEAYDKTMNVNVKSALFLSLAASPYLEKTGGCVVNISSILSTMVGPKYLVYAMSKAAMDHMTRTMGVGLGPMGIRVNAVNPSFIPETGIGREFPDTPDGAGKKKFLQDEIARQPLYGTCATANDIARSVCYLASAESRFITGQCHIVDGGRAVMGPTEASF